MQLLNYFHEDLLSLIIRPFYEILMLQKLGAIWYLLREEFKRTCIIMFSLDCVFCEVK